MVPWKLWAAVAGLLAIDVILLLVWTLVDPLSREVGTAILQPSHRFLDLDPHEFFLFI